jgi:hypothetical protein
MKNMIDCTARTNLVMVPDLRDEIRPVLPAYFIGSGFGAKSFIDGNNVDWFINFFKHKLKFEIISLWNFAL